MTVETRMMNQWYKLIQIANSIQTIDEDDDIICQFNSAGNSAQSMYAVINNRGVKPIFTPVMWKLTVPSRLRIFLCMLLANNKTLTRYNLAKRRNVNDMSCLFCNKPETVNHLFFGCCVASFVMKFLILLGIKWAMTLSE
jgi:hypothetical protein